MHKRYSEEQIVKILQEVDTSQNVLATARKYEVSAATIHRWKTSYQGMSLSDVKHMKTLEAENTQMKRIIAQQAIDIDALKQLLGKKW
jgi:putative transposase